VRLRRAGQAEGYKKTIIDVWPQTPGTGEDRQSPKAVTLFLGNTHIGRSFGLVVFLAKSRKTPVNPAHPFFAIPWEICP